MITLLEDDDECASCGHFRTEHALSEAEVWKAGAWSPEPSWTYEECDFAGCNCQGFTEP